MENILKVGIDIGSTTIKYIILDKYNSVCQKRYFRHFSEINKALNQVFAELNSIVGLGKFKLAITGSSGMGMAQKLNIEFVQEVVACARAVKMVIPQTDVAVEIGGEDAKITYFGLTPEQRMNGVCAGGTGAFIDQMASLLETDAAGLNELAKNYKQIYPIAARCGVFAKTDVQSLINDGIDKNDIAVSIFQAVANQVIGTLSQGRTIKGKVAFLGGPLYFLSELKKRFIETLGLKPEQIAELPDACYMVALGTSINAMSDYSCELFFQHQTVSDVVCYDGMEPLFANDDEYKAFVERHSQARLPMGTLESYQGKVYLGIDAGSTTTKVVLLGEQREILYSYYSSNRGMALNSVCGALLDLYGRLNDQTEIAGSGVAGYGEQIVKAALNVDIGEVETVAHLRAAQEFCPDVDFVLDIGGQDMKSFFVHNGVIDNIMLNEACSAGCGSFIENFASGLNMSVQEFSQLGIKAKQPVDLGTRCTVFMNSRVKQAQKDGASVADISAGLAISVIKNALFKVIQLHDTAAIGSKVVVQGGTFYNDAVLRALEILLQRDVIRPDIAGLMGAYGMALLAMERCSGSTNLLKIDELRDFSLTTQRYRCKGCTNQCLITSQRFSNGKVYNTGNRCERGVGGEYNVNKLPDAYQFKLDRLFSYVPLAEKKAVRGVIGLPRVLNMYEDYPFWFTFFTELGYRVVLSAESSVQLQQQGMDTIPSDSLCYPAKLAHGHIVDLIERGVKKIFYPCIPYNEIEETGIADNTYNCPIVASYPENIRANIELLAERQVKFIQPFLPMRDKKRLIKRLCEVLSDEGVPSAAVKQAVLLADAEQKRYKADLRDYGNKAIEFMQDENIAGIILAGRPYHADEEINHGIARLLGSFGLAVLSEDTVCHNGSASLHLGAVNQWSFHARLYQAAEYANRNSKLNIIQLSSFGCGLDAVTIPQMKEIVEGAGNIYTMIKLDEVNNISAVRIRIRSLLAALGMRRTSAQAVAESAAAYEGTAGRSKFTDGRRQTDVILAPQLAPIQFPFIVHTLNKHGYRVEIPPITGKREVNIGLKYVNQDICYPAVIIIGQMIAALQSGKYDLAHTSIMMFQSGGACRATNYLQLMNQALCKAGFGQVPVFACWGSDTDSFVLSKACIMDIVKSMIYGDLLMRLSQSTRPYESNKGETNRLYKLWEERCKEEISQGNYFKFSRFIQKMVVDFENVPVDNTLVKPQVGIVGEILVKYHPVANNNIVDVLENEGMEVVLPDLLDFIMYMAYDGKIKYNLLDGGWKDSAAASLFIKLLEFYRRPMNKALRNSRRYRSVWPIAKIASLASRHVSLGNIAGEGWFLTGEMLKYIKEGINNIICLQPFGCLPNHIVGKGMIREILRSYPEANIVAIDCDAGASEVNQLNRIKLMAAIAKEKIK